MKPITKITVAVIALLFALQSFAQTGLKTAVQPAGQSQSLKLRCCFKIGLPVIKFKRPKKDCKSGFGLCVTNVYACIICTLDGSAPDCSKCGQGRTSDTDIELSGTIDEETSTVTLELPTWIKTLPENRDEDFSTFYLDEDVTIYDASSPADAKAVLKAGTYTVSEVNGALKISIRL